MKKVKLSGVQGDLNFGTAALAGTSTVANLNGVQGLNASQGQNYSDVPSDYKPIFSYSEETTFPSVLGEIKTT